MKQFTLLFVLFLFTAVACATEPETVTVVETVMSEVTVEVEVTREVVVEQEVEVTREVVVEQEVEVTREVVVEQEVEVTRVVEVEVMVTATEEPTPEATATATPAPVPTSPPAPAAPPAPPAPSADARLLDSMLNVRSNLQSFGGMIDRAINEGFVSCEDIVDTYDAVVLAPTYDVSSASVVTQGAYPAYRLAIQTFADGAWDMTQNCRDFLANPSYGEIGFQQWGSARANVNNALDVLHPAIQAMGGE
jgi:hypothetical protein